MLVDRARLRSDPARLRADARRIARAVDRVAPGQDYLIDNISNTLQVARDDAAVGKRMFVFLGLPGVLLAAFLAAYAGSILASAQRREQATLRIRGAHRAHLRRILATRTARARRCRLRARCRPRVRCGADHPRRGHAVRGVDQRARGVGAHRRSHRHARDGTGPLPPGSQRPAPRGRARSAARSPRARSRCGSDGGSTLALVAVAIGAEIVALRSGAFDAPIASVSAGEAVSLPSSLLIAPMVRVDRGRAARGATRRVVRLAAARPDLALRPVVGGTLLRSVRRRSRTLAAGIIGVGLVSAFGVSIVMFASTYDEAKAADARFAVGADLRITPSVLSPRPSPSYASTLTVDGVSGVTPIVFKLDNSVLIGPHNQDRENLTAIDPTSFGTSAPCRTRSSSASRPRTRSVRCVPIRGASSSSRRRPTISRWSEATTCRSCSRRAPSTRC